MFHYVTGTSSNAHKDLPIFEIEQQVLEALTAQKRLVLTAPTGSGKSTQVPQMLLDGGLLGTGRVTILQPRRLATRLLAGWVAQARNAKLGGEVGYQMRLDNMSSAATRICYVTEGVLLRQMLGDPRLNGISALIFDEFHERHLYGDITLARALQIQEVDAARSDDHRHVGDFGCRRGGEISPALRGAVVAGARLSGEHRISGQARRRRAGLGTSGERTATAGARNMLRAML